MSLLLILKILFCVNEEFLTNNELNAISLICPNNKLVVHMLERSSDGEIFRKLSLDFDAISSDDTGNMYKREYFYNNNISATSANSENILALFYVYSLSKKPTIFTFRGFTTIGSDQFDGFVLTLFLIFEFYFTTN